MASRLSCGGDGDGGDDEDDDDEDFSSEEDFDELPERETHHRCDMSQLDMSKALRVAVHQEEVGFFDPKETDRLKQLITGDDKFFLRAWRRKLDPHGTLECPFPKFCKVCVDIGFVKSADSLYAIPREFTNITLMQVNPEMGGLLESFRRWIVMKYHSNAVFYDAFDQDGSNRISPDEFVDSCASEGFSGTHDELCEIFACCDWEGDGEISRDEVVFLETDPVVKERELQQIKRRKQYEIDKLRADSYTEELANKRPMHDRKAIRPWLSRSFEIMPEIQRHVKAMQDKTKLDKGLSARVSFIHRIRMLHGNEITAWRRVLDVDAKFVVTESRFRQLCRQLDVQGDVNALWYNLDPDHDGTLTLEQLSVQPAVLLASFRGWAVQNFGSCMGLWESPECTAKRKKKHAWKHKMSRPVSLLTYTILFDIDNS